jgi:hypothetical protein
MPKKKRIHADKIWKTGDKKGETVSMRNKKDE